ncbi:sulfatase-like hydrolase/transferase [Prosthecobacter sp.]|uniref:sulfatase-like hydrolase/transferase n=1 Tax=Prosthecobacter sp. TaxID=1965333 RepID=UPI001D4CFA1A|nr:sulfatase-like hydrolase/transferase [Prosthecobacter sp.]MCB1278666.1 sulfatase-like hydrolase/transferase [Prosthecobacter sp.]
MKSLFLACLLPALFLPLSSDAAPPNILFIYADDWGWGDLACHGHPHLKTPHLDRLAKEGTDFQQFVVCNPVCSPSRTAIVTGQYPARHLVHQHFASHAENEARGMPDWLEPKVTLLPRLMKNAGYTTAHYGKWHLSGGGKDIDAPLPTEYGYDDAAVWTGPGRSVFEDTSVEKQAGDAHDKSGASFQTIAAAEHVLRFIRDASGKKQPFYINFWLHETHHLVAATEEQKAPYPDTSEPQRTYYSAVTRADAQIGRVLALLDELKLADDTIVIFSSDNGPENSMPEPGQKFYYSVGTTGGLRGRKRSLYMGGVNVPFIVRWPGHVPAGRVDKTSVIAGVDMLPTLLAASGIPLPAGYQSDGLNVLAAFNGEPFTRPQPLFWEWRGPNSHEADWPQLAMRDGFFTLLMKHDGSHAELYDLTKDRGQENDLVTAQPERVANMTTALRAWQQTLPVTTPPPAPTPRKAPPATPSKPAPDRAAVFKKWDKDADGILTLEEYTNGLSKKENAAQRFKNFDKNGDGKLTRDEFVTP